MRETVVERYLVKRVKEHGGVAEKHVSPGRRAVPDRDVMWPGPILDWIETKAPKGVLSEAQKRDHKRRRALGFNVFVIWTKPQVDAYVQVYRTLHLLRTA